jgi:hypothetical protein
LLLGKTPSDVPTHPKVIYVALSLAFPSVAQQRDRNSVRQ